MSGYIEGESNHRPRYFATPVTASMGPEGDWRLMDSLFVGKLIA
jgi:hypothetical protein